MKTSSQRFRGRLAYDGTHYLGFQRQAPEKPTVQGTLEAAIAQIIGKAVTIHAAGRTDTGVHARGQVIAFNCEWRHSPEALCRAINAKLPASIVLRELAPTHTRFHPRYDALSRRYVYRFYTAPTPDPLLNYTQWYVGQSINIPAMLQAAFYLVGSHDFATFGRPTSGSVTVRHLYYVGYRHHGGGEHSLTLEANAFLKRMVRSIIGSLMDVGHDYWTVAHFRDAFYAAQRDRAGTTAPPQGLVLDDVTYRGENDES